MSAASPSGSLESGYNPRTSSHGHSGAELTRQSLSARTLKQIGNCSAKLLKVQYNHDENVTPDKTPKLVMLFNGQRERKVRRPDSLVLHHVEGKEPRRLKGK